MSAQQRFRTVAEVIEAYTADMTLADAMNQRHLDYVCACAGPPNPSPRGTPCYCDLGRIGAEALHRGAHIVAKLMADAAGGERDPR